jgi:TolB-like protein
MPLRPKAGRRVTAFVLAVAATAVLLLLTVAHSVPQRPAAEANHAATATSPEAPAAAQRSIAVLPFAGRGHGDSSRWLAAGMHADVLDALTSVRGLQVISRASLDSLGSGSDPVEAATALGAANILLGEVRQQNGRLQVEARLVAVGAGEETWAGTWDRSFTLRQLATIQAEIARAVATTLRADLRPQAPQKAATRNPEAYRMAVRSRWLSERGEPHALQRALKIARRAVALDPDYGAAQLALAIALGRAEGAALRTEPGAEAQVEAAFEAASRLLPDDAEVPLERGLYLSMTGKPGAEQVLREALQIRPGDARIMHGLGLALHRGGHTERALPHLLEARELDPLSTGLLTTLGNVYDGLGRYEQARETFARLRLLAPEEADGYHANARILYARGDLAGALYWMEQAAEREPRPLELGGWIMALHDCLEDFEAADRWLEWLDGRITKQTLPMAMMARHHYLTGNFLRASQLSRRALELGATDRGGSRAILLRIKRDEALALGRPADGIAIFRAHHPELFAEPPRLAAESLQQAVDLAQLLQLDGRPERARLLLEAVLAFHQRPLAVAGSQRAWLVPTRAEALSLLGRHDAALAELQRIVDDGWRLYWRWETELNFNFQDIRETDDFRKIVRELTADASEQRARVRAMEANGEMPPPPGTKS